MTKEYRTSLILLSTGDTVMVWGDHFDLTNTHPEATFFTAQRVLPSATGAGYEKPGDSAAFSFANVVMMQNGPTLTPTEEE